MTMGNEPNQYTPLGNGPTHGRAEMDERVWQAMLAIVRSGTSDISLGDTEDHIGVVYVGRYRLAVLAKRMVEEWERLWP